MNECIYARADGRSVPFRPSARVPEPGRSRTHDRASGDDRAQDAGRDNASNASRARSDSSDATDRRTRTDADTGSPAHTDTGAGCDRGSDQRFGRTNAAHGRRRRTEWTRAVRRRRRVAHSDRTQTPVKLSRAVRARSSTGQSSGLLIRRFRVRVPASARNHARVAIARAAIRRWSSSLLRGVRRCGRVLPPSAGRRSCVPWG